MIIAELAAHQYSFKTIPIYRHMQVVGSNDKKRFVIDDSSTPPRIRATQGHRWAKASSEISCGYSVSNLRPKTVFIRAVWVFIRADMGTILA